MTYYPYIRTRGRSTSPCKCWPYVPSYGPQLVHLPFRRSILLCEYVAVAHPFAMSGYDAVALFNAINGTRQMPNHVSIDLSTVLVDHITRVGKCSVEASICAGALPILTRLAETPEGHISMSVRTSVVFSMASLDVINLDEVCPPTLLVCFLCSACRT
ncbi:hypothetical protein EDC04DRAFT_2215128 [Pisolithus marmoratus]|nr:hypothetical protein EDC04DRAFT_2215128 [Pisolithus marmoratus]